MLWLVLVSRKHRLQNHRSFCTYQLLHPPHFGGDRRRHSTRLIATVHTSYQLCVDEQSRHQGMLMRHGVL